MTKVQRNALYNACLVKHALRGKVAAEIYAEFCRISVFLRRMVTAAGANFMGHGII
jgi:hypothetical protein